MNRRVAYSLAFLFLTVLLLLFLWKQVVLLSFLLVLIAYAKYRIAPIKRELLWYVLVSLAGGITEIILVNIGRAWSYTGPGFLGLPIQMVLFWGVVGTTVVIIYDELVGK
ncbi:hypothetical protein A3K34_02345 [candidate division WWE3 bacterium RIFOXYC1_FULL_40_10]|uniref:Lycopene cyclase domain-containing protein n=1 Tax=candidate division WWE3 bacterium RIFOXYA2_FULL_46_9 TaxID=1802636 RepID=A0A1F4VZU6_UNCKA|nr:MAG: hypothetical protein A3K58_02345 [candidate division WWE3 bacterium RIFOXYB1_FULL_40_22]OGC61692.1 MAG: hypothetical protein A3K37_02345 [candidate division WWE3 bacterium RIFOXYA1_FULL_40_11]OGC62323.1 MAG: hypothetical protein A2264_02025 [candidate division WWE3 bacterium RIFOXYA2_FULL_46_9]OGC64867.1 MAG: hypothetical protein A2326_01170 [candidate division WWE3 bacterium RIFOXYB2_FULL_41_6]OGC66075.1 MAG: hypothetical protein A3K34_02345 [candidate division WWE3 bacterium RIFOXYC1_